PFLPFWKGRRRPQVRVWQRARNPRCPRSRPAAPRKPPKVQILPELWQTRTMVINRGIWARAVVMGALFGAGSVGYAEPTQAATDEERAAARSLAEQGATAYAE